MRYVLFFLLLLFSIVGCNGTPLNGGGASPPPPQLLHVFDGTTLGFYNDTGGYGFKVRTASIFSLGQNFGTVQQVPQDTMNGLFYIGSTQCLTNCNEVVYFTGYTGGFRSGGLSGSSANLPVGGTSTGLAVDSSYSHLYVADSTNNLVYALDAAIGVIQGVPMHPPTGLGATYLGFDSYLRRLLVAENILGAVWVVDGSSGAIVPTSPSQLTLTSAGCVAGSVGFIALNSPSHLAYVLCGGSVVYLRTSNTPSYFGSSAATSTVSLSPITTGNDIVYDAGASSVVAVGQHYVVGLDATTLSQIATTDVLTGDCGFVAADLEGVAYSSTKGTIYVADALNSVVYLLDAGTLNFKNGLCSKSNFSTASDVPNPKRLSYF